VLRRVSVVFLTLVLVLGVAACAWAAGPKIVLDGAELWSDVAPFETGGRTMVPLRVVGESLFATVGWDPAAKKVTVVQDGKTVVLMLGSKQALVNGEARLLDAPATTRNGRVFVPLRFVSETLGCKVEYSPGVVSVVSPDDGSKAYLMDVINAYRSVKTVKIQGNYKEVLKEKSIDRTQTYDDSVSLSGWYDVPNKASYLMVGNIEVYSTGNKVYVREGSQPWLLAISTEDPLSDPNLISTDDLKDIFCRFLPDENINEKQCKVIIHKNIGQRISQNLEHLYNSDLQLLFQGMDHDTGGDVNFSLWKTRRAFVKTYVDPDTKLYVKRIMIYDQVSSDLLLGAEFERYVELVIDYSDYNGQVTPPDVSGAVAKTGGQ